MIAQRLQVIAPSETLKISGRAKELQREGKSVISLSQGEPDFKTPEHICDAAIKAVRDGHHGYTMNPGTPELREAICKKLKEENGLDYTPAQIILSNGAKQSIGFALYATLDKGDEVIIPAPYWVSYPEMVKLAEGTPVVVSTAFENDYKMTAEQLKEAITPKTKMLILCSPSNPTGSCYSKDELKALADVLKDHPNILILSDEIYEYIVFDGEHVGIAQAAPELKDRVLLINGFSKGFAMTGWRLGYLAATTDIVKAVGKIQSQLTSAPCTISQKAGEAAYLSPRDSVKKMVEAFRERRAYLVQALNEIEGVKCFNPGGAFYAFPDISAYLNSKTPSGDEIKTSTDLCMFLLEERGLAAVPGDAFGEPSGIRLSYAASMEHLQEAIKRLKEGLAALSK
ncbi:pyridoxal phosphate-dependent aminotransferase [Balneolaceae bacterium ANBcel3]|nr:pyridoxal phosphate-dependent aminotransferase [Balneolaceae bacterium ANBcel3]